MEIFNDFNLNDYNTFGIDCIAKYFVTINSDKDLEELTKQEIFQKNKFFILGCGSNILFKDNFDGLIILINIKGVRAISQTDESVLIEAGAGEKWHDFVTSAIENNFFGIENLALIPGSVGAAPVQNIGAYGVEQKEFFHSLKGFNLKTERYETLTSRECNFGYRNSVFKKELANNFVITEVCYELNKIPHVNYGYKDLQAEFQAKGISEPTPRDIFDAICKIRTAKLPDVNELGNAGSFFKNPVISSEKFSELKSYYPEIKGFEQNEGSVKVSAAWLIEKAGWKGYREKDAGVSSKHSLVLVNYGNAKGNDILNLSEKISEDVRQKFDIELKREVLVVK